MKTISAESIKSLLLTNAGAVQRAMVQLLARQTEGERNTGATVESNGEGFSGGPYGTAAKGTYFALWVLGLHSTAEAHVVRAAILTFLAGKGTGRALTGHHLVKARKIAIFHHKQIARIAQAKADALEALDATSAYNEANG
jgi:hypothetical protein